jgi:uncharacterized protein YdhG (YjbR/CyaY superfamily)
MELKKQPDIQTTDDYISLQPAEVQHLLTQIRQAIKKGVPEAKETISYKMPAFTYNGIIAWFAVFKKHISVFYKPHCYIPFESELKKYRKTKSALSFPFGTTIPYELITKIASYAALENLAAKQAKDERKKI